MQTVAVCSGTSWVQGEALQTGGGHKLTLLFEVVSSDGLNFIFPFPFVYIYIISLRDYFFT